MTATEIKQAVDEGKTVHWCSEAYTVTKDKREQYFIKCNINNHHIGLTWADGKTLNGKPEDFYEAEPEDPTKI